MHGDSWCSFGPTPVAQTSSNQDRPLGCLLLLKDHQKRRDLSSWSHPHDSHLPPPCRHPGSVPGRGKAILRISKVLKSSYAETAGYPRFCICSIPIE